MIVNVGLREWTPMLANCTSASISFSWVVYELPRDLI